MHEKTCTKIGCNQPRYKTYYMCEKHIKAYWRSYRRGGAKAQPPISHIAEMRHATHN